MTARALAMDPWHPCRECGVAPTAREAAEDAEPVPENMPTVRRLGWPCLGGRQCYERGHCDRCDLCLDWAFRRGLLGLRAAYYRSAGTRVEWVRGLGHWAVVPTAEDSDTDTDTDRAEEWDDRVSRLRRLQSESVSEPPSPTGPVDPGCTTLPSSMGPEFGGLVGSTRLPGETDAGPWPVQPPFHQPVEETWPAPE
jgi:hypothetical protein